MLSTLHSTTTAQVRKALIERSEIALLDVREEGPFAEAHPLFAASLPLGRLELEIGDRVPRRSTRIVVYDNGEGLNTIAVDRLRTLGYSDVSLLEGGLDGWRRAGGEIFRDVNTPSKAFGELVEARRHTPSLDAVEVKALLDAHADVVILDARRFEEYRTMSLPTALSVPGAELVYRVQAAAPSPSSLVVVNCAGRTRSIIGAQSLVNAGIPNRVAALRNGTIGWTLAGFALDHGQTRSAPAVPIDIADRSRVAARQVAERAGVSAGSVSRSGSVGRRRRQNDLLFRRAFTRRVRPWSSPWISFNARRAARAGNRCFCARPRRANRALGPGADPRRHDCVVACANGLGCVRSRRCVAE